MKKPKPVMNQNTFVQKVVFATSVMRRQTAKRTKELAVA